jgi:uncharacterized cupredoxin-like copper-binding protein
MVENKKRILIWAIVGVVIALGIVILALSNGGADSANTIVKTITQEQKTPAKTAAEEAKTMENLSVSQSAFVSQENLPKGTIDLVVSLEKGFVPNQFTVKKGERVALAITSEGALGHTFVFKDPSIVISLNAGPGETNFASFIAPSKAGEYAFKCELPGHEENGEVGKMIVE